MKKEQETTSFICPNCNKKIEPLLSFDGSLWCPDCKSDVFEAIKINDGDKEAESDAEFAMSQEFFVRYLSIANDVDPSGRKRARKYLNAAISCCRNAAYEGNAYALLNLGYYYSIGYDELVSVETGKVFAKRCYDIVEKSGKEELVKLARNNKRLLFADAKKQSSDDLGYLKTLIERISSTSATPERIPRLGIFRLDSSAYPEEASKELLHLATICGGKDMLYVYDDNDANNNHPATLELAGQATDPANVTKYHYWGYVNMKTKPRNDQKSIVKKEIFSKNARSEIEQNLSIVCAEMKTKKGKGVTFCDSDIVTSFPKERTESSLDALTKRFQAMVKEN